MKNTRSNKHDRNGNYNKESQNTILDEKSRVMVTQLREIFPDQSEQALIQAVEQHKSEQLEAIVERIITQQTEGTTELDQDVLKLCELLPDISLEDVKQEYEHNDGDFYLTLYKLQNPLCMNGDKEEEQQDEEEEDKKQPQQKLAHMCGQPEELALKYLEDHQGDIIKALIALVLNEISTNSSPQPYVRVQRSDKKSKKKTQYTYSSTSPEAKEMNQLYEESDEMKLISKDFLIKLLISLKGDLNKVLDITGLIFEAQYQNLTFESIWSLGQSPERSKTYSAAAQSSSCSEPTIKDSKDKDLPFLPTPKSRISSSNSETELLPKDEYKQILQACDRTHRLDLHNLHLDDAIRLTKQAVGDWWRSEHVARVNEGRLHNYNRLAQFVDPIQIVTGRGIHSKGGISRIRIHVGKYLRDNQYIYDEETWGYIVRGKRK